MTHHTTVGCRRTCLPVVLVRASHHRGRRTLVPDTPTVTLTATVVALEDAPRASFFSFFYSVVEFVVCSLGDVKRNPTLHFSLTFGYRLSVTWDSPNQSSSPPLPPPSFNFFSESAIISPTFSTQDATHASTQLNAKLGLVPLGVFFESSPKAG